MGEQVRQGDVFFAPIEKLPKGVVLEKGRRIVAEGDATGHHHKLAEIDTDSRAEIFSLEDELFVKVQGSVVVNHQEHSTLAVDEGLYQIRIEREYTPEEVRRVLD